MSAASVVQALPGEMRVRIAKVPLGGTLLDIGTTPMPTALPIPANAVAQKRINIPVISTATAEPTVTITAVFQEPIRESNPAATIAPTNTPTATPLPTNTSTPVPLPKQARIEGMDIIAQGTSLTRLGELSGEAAFYENGAAAFDQAFILGLPPRMLWYQYRPYIAYMKMGRYQEMIDLADVILTTQGGQNVEETYLYKGHALAFLGDGAGAVTAYKQALARNENFYPAQWALDSIIGG